MAESVTHALSTHEVLQDLTSLLEVTIEPATDSVPASATLWAVTSQEKNQRHPLAIVTTSNMYVLPLLLQLHDTLEKAKVALGETKTETP